MHDLHGVRQVGIHGRRDIESRRAAPEHSHLIAQAAIVRTISLVRTKPEPRRRSGTWSSMNRIRPRGLSTERAKNWARNCPPRSGSATVEVLAGRRSAWASSIRSCAASGRALLAVFQVMHHERPDRKQSAARPGRSAGRDRHLRNTPERMRRRSHRNRAPRRCGRQQEHRRAEIDVADEVRFGTVRRLVAQVADGRAVAPNDAARLPATRRACA